MSFNTLYYHLKPFIPRWLQISLRKRLIRRKRALYADVWPIDPEAGTPPPAWAGWPGGKKFALLLTHDVETWKGQENCQCLIELEKKLGFKSAFGFVPERYKVCSDLRHCLEESGFEVVVHGLYHDGKYYKSKGIFQNRARRINHYLKEWRAVGFRSPSMLHNLDWIHSLNIEYDSSTFDTDPFEPQSDGVGTIFPFWVKKNGDPKEYIELPYTIPQDFTLFVLMGERGIGIWKQKLDWIAEKGGMVLLISHPDYMNFGGNKQASWEYPADYYEDFLKYVKTYYKEQYWHVLPKELARFWAEHYKFNPDEIFNPPSKKEEAITLMKSNVPILRNKKIWIDLDNSPHVPFFSPIIKELDNLGGKVIITARECSQTCGLADLFHLHYKRIGRHYGKNKFIKVAGTFFRAFQLSKLVKKEKPSLALSHGSRALTAAARMLGIPSLTIADYEHANRFINPTWLMVPDIIDSNAIQHDKGHILKYPGIKEDVYVPFFKPNPQIQNELGIKEENIIVTIRPPATEAHYHNPESEILFEEVVNYLGLASNVRMVILPRNDIQKALIKDKWAEWFENGKIVIPEKVVDGLNLLWHSDLVISGGGTMNREAAALGVPVYSIFRGKIGDVDRYLAHTGRLTFIESADDVKTKIAVVKRDQAKEMEPKENITLGAIVNEIVKVLEAQK